jgi:hypothetical protein
MVVICQHFIQAAWNVQENYSSCSEMSMFASQSNDAHHQFLHNVKITKFRM